MLVTQDHPFEKGPFSTPFDSLDDVDYTHVEQPAAQAFLDRERAPDLDAFVCYDMLGTRFAGEEPQDETRAAAPEQ